MLNLNTLTKIRDTAEEIGRLKERWSLNTSTCLVGSTGEEDNERCAEQYAALEGRMIELQGQLVQEVEDWANRETGSPMTNPVGEKP